MAQDTLHFSDEQTEVRMPRINTLQLGRNGTNDHQNEDLVLVHKLPNGVVMAAIDGITQLTGWRGQVEIDGKTLDVTSGWIAARVVAKNLIQLDPGSDFSDLLGNIVEDWNFARMAHGIPDDEILGAVFCAYVQFDGGPGEFWQLGDCGWGVLTDSDTPEWIDSLNGKMPDNSRDADLRAEVILPQLDKLGVEYPDGLLDQPKVLASLAKQGFQTMREKRKARRGEDYLWLTDIDAMLAHDHVKEPVQMPERLKKLVLVTDGMLIVPQSIEDGLAFLAELREEDPLMVGLNKLGLRTAKGFVDMETGEIRPFTDDVGMIEVTF